MKWTPYATVAATAGIYSVILSAVTQSELLGENLRTQVKAISTAHSTVTTLIAVYLLKYGHWPVDESTVTTKKQAATAQGRSDDSANPIIAGHNNYGNALTAFETGYLIYDTAALMVETHLKYKTKGLRATTASLAKHSPIFLAHHVALISALMYLQHYIAHGWEKGLWVITAMIGMNASNPLLHLRWWLKKQTGKVDNRVDAALATVFAFCRFGNVYWVLGKYGDYHGMSAWESLRKQRTVCQTGTNLLIGVNAIWWLGLVKKIVTSSLRSRGNA